MINLSKKIVGALVSKKIVNDGQKDIYEYGIKYLFLLGTNILTVVFVAIITKSILQVCFFMCSFAPLRSYVGGYHLRNSTYCYIVSTIIIIMVLILGKYINIGCLCILTALSLVFILRNSPIECANRLYDESEKSFFRKRAKYILCCEIGFAVVLLLFKRVLMAKYIFIAIILTTILGLIGKVVNSIHKTDI